MGNIFKKKPKYHFFFGNESIGGFEVDFYMTENKPKDCYVHIHGKSPDGGIFDVRLNGYTYGYLMESARQGKEDNIHGLCVMLFTLASQVYVDEGLRNDVIKAIGKYQKRLMKKAGEAAKSVTPEQDTADQAFMESVAEYAAATPKRRKEISRADRELMREVLNENKEGGHD